MELIFATIGDAPPIALREELGRKVRLHAEGVDGFIWKDHQTEIEEADIIYATWRMPQLD